jgi:hypothetical protein
MLAPSDGTHIPDSAIPSSSAMQNNKVEQNIHSFRNFEQEKL